MRSTRRRSLRRAHLPSSFILAAALLMIACGDDGNQYAPLPEHPQASVITGIVRDAGHKSIPDAIVTIEPAVNGVAQSVNDLVTAGASGKQLPAATVSSGRRITTTNDHGRFAFQNVGAGEYFMNVIADDHLGATRSLTVPGGPALLDTIIVDVNLTPTGTFTGSVTLENATVHQATVVYVQGTSYVAVTDPAGAFAITNVPVGSYTLRAQHPGYLEDTRNGTLTSAGQVLPLASMLLRLDANISPTATITSATPPVGNVPINFVASGADVDGTIVRYEWDWEDDGIFDYSSPSTGSTTHTYPNGTFTAKFRVTDDDGATGLAAITLILTPNQAPVASIVSASPQQHNVPANFIANGNDPDGSITLYEWDWTDDGVYDYSSPSTGNASHTYTTGSYTARFRVTDNLGATGTATIALSIAPPAKIYMSWRGNDTNFGTAESPVLTLDRAYFLALAAGTVDQILIEEGSYSIVPNFIQGISIMGGRIWPSWSEGAAYSVFLVGTSRGSASNITVATTIRRVELQGSSSASGNSNAMYVSGSTAALRFETCRFIAKNAASGVPGASGSAGSTGNPGGNGQNGTCDGANGAGAGGGSSPAGCPGGAGGAGGSEGTNPGVAGTAGSCGGGAGGTPGAAGSNSLFQCNNPGGPGGNGGTGTNGGTGSTGLAGNGGTVISGQWVPSAGGNGSPGAAGRGGGGGGGGGGQGGGACNDGGGNGAGGGGGGGGGGTAGGGGTGGYASFAVLLVNCTQVQFDTCYFETGLGGSGGAGGNGGASGNGGAGGIGASNCTAEVGRGGNGGGGGNGGQGGGGGGGAGGASYGIYRSSSTVLNTSPTFLIGGPGSGGAAGLPNGQAGVAGASGNTN